MTREVKIRYEGQKKIGLRERIKTHHHRMLEKRKRDQEEARPKLEEMCSGYRQQSFGWHVHRALEVVLGDDYHDITFTPWNYFDRRPVFASYIADVLLYLREQNDLHGAQRGGVRGKVRSVVPLLGFRRMWIRAEVESENPIATHEAISFDLATIESRYSKWITDGLKVDVTVVQVEPRLKIVGE